MITHLMKNISAVKYQILSGKNLFGFILTNQISYMNLNNFPPWLNAMSYQNINTPLNGDETEVEIVNWNSNGKLGFSITGGVGSLYF